MDINDLPLETFAEILTKTDGFTLGKCRRVCKQWKEIIDETDFIWEQICRKEFPNASSIAKKRSGSDCRWYHLYRNLNMWKNVEKLEKNIREFYKFSFHDKNHALSIDYGVLPLRDTRGIVLYDMTNLKYIPVAVPEKNILKIANNDYATVMLVKSGILLQRTADNPTYMTEAFFRADNFVLFKEELYFYNNKDVYKCDLSLPNLESKLILRSDYDIKELVYNSSTVFLFSHCGKIISIDKDKTVSIKPINCPPEWIKQIKHITAINNKNFICYSRNLFKIETDNYKHLYLDFPPITALFFYGDFVLIGTRGGEILLYRLSSQIYKSKPIFETIGQLSDGKFAVHLDVCERKHGPVIIVATFFEVMLLEIDFFPQEKDNKTRYPMPKLKMYKRFQILKDRLRVGVPSVKSIA